MTNDASIPTNATLLLFMELAFASTILAPWTELVALAFVAR